MEGQSVLVTWGFSKVTRRKGGTIGGHNPRNGYAPNQKSKKQKKGHRNPTLR
jgi:hypothetical protein